MNSVPLILDITGKDNNQSSWPPCFVKDGYACELLSTQGCKVAIDGFNIRLIESKIEWSEPSLCSLPLMVFYPLLKDSWGSQPLYKADISLLQKS